MDILKYKDYTKSLFISVLLTLVLSFIFFKPDAISSLLVNEANPSIDHIITSDEYRLLLTDEEQQWLNENPILKLGIIRAYPPFGSITSDDQYIGYHADLKRIIEHRLKIKFDIDQDATWDQTLEMAAMGELDAIIGLVKSEQRSQFLTFTDSYISNPTVIINDGVKHGFIGSLANLKDRTVALEKGSFSSEKLKNDYPEIKQVKVSNAKQALKLVATDKVDAFVGNAVTANHLIKRYNHKNLFFAGETEYSSNHRIGVDKNKPILQSILSKVLNSISPATRNHVSEYWLGKKVQRHIDPKMVVKSGVILIVLFFVSLFWAFRLRKARNKLRKTKKIIQIKSEQDELTGLGNRKKFYELLRKEIKSSMRHKHSFILLHLNLDGFKEINNNFSHAIGDLIIKEAAKRILAVAPSQSKVTRSSGDSFMVIIPEGSTRLDAESVSKRIQKSMSYGYCIDGNDIYTSACIGISRYPEDTSNAEDLIKNAEQAMYHAKKLGANRFSYFNQEMRRKVVERNNTIRDMRTAIAEQQFELHFQPIVDMSTNKVTKAEALVRWNHPEKGLIYPDKFIDIAEETGQIVEIGEWVFKQAVLETAKFRKILGDEFQMSINTSPLQYGKNGMDVSDWVSHIITSGVPARNITLELTEGVLMESKDTSRMNKLYNLRDLNVKISIDDFGTGYSSLSYLQKFDIDFLKIDRSFVQDLTTNESNVALIQAMIVMAHKLGCKVIAEGIEDEAQRDILVSEGCDYGQGYYYSKPLPSAEFLETSSQWNKKGHIENNNLKLVSA